MNEETLYSIALKSTPFVGDINFMRLVEAAGSAKEAWHLSKHLKKEIRGIGTKISSAIGDESYLKIAEEEIEICLKNNIQILLRQNNELPHLLSQAEDAPAVLYVKGNVQSNKENLSIVGTRSMTAYGKHFIDDLCQNLKEKEITIVSGLALGTDGYAHKGALLNGLNTVAVLAHGFSTLYPSSHRKLSEEILDTGGALVTEYLFHQKPDRENFLQRNRIIAALSKVTVVCESAYGGGSMSTVSYANQYNREVFALPGKIMDKYSQGCNQIIAQNKARIISSISEILDELGLNSKQKTLSLFPSKEINLKGEEKNVFDEIARNQPITLDSLSFNLELPPFKILPVLLNLELAGYIKTLSGRQYAVN